ncbi:Hypothetical protein A7982_01683 [Minicystis rosea]|nr:Hypothetical protein A7982_01683 [Minicystis rosea]
MAPDLRGAEPLPPGPLSGLDAPNAAREHHAGSTHIGVSIALGNMIVDETGTVGAGMTGSKRIKTRTRQTSFEIARQFWSACAAHRSRAARGPSPLTRPAKSSRRS